jgi:iron complex outermembrane receptor protein
MVALGRFQFPRNSAHTVQNARVQRAISDPERVVRRGRKRGLPLDLLLLALTTPLAASAQQPPQAVPIPTFTSPPVIVTAQKEPADARRLPVSVTAVSGETVAGVGFGTISDAVGFSPNTRVVELSARKISNLFVRGIGSSPSNPGITTFIDGVPQLNSNSANIELLDVAQIEFVRGPQSALFGRNTLGGLASITSVRPPLTGWTAQVAAPFGSAGERDARAAASGPVSGSLALGLAYGHRQRDGFTVNDLTGHALDSRSADFGKAQVLWVPAPSWEARLILRGERARDGDYALNDLGELRRNPFHVTRDFEGRTDRDIWSTTVLLRHEASRVAFSSTTGFVSWETYDLTDLDYTAYPFATRENAEQDRQFTQEFRLASNAQSPLRLADRVALKWQAGVFLFTQDYSQDAVNHFAPGALSPSLPLQVDQHSPQSALDGAGLGVYGQGTLTVGESVDMTLGARVDRERKNAQLDTFYAPAIAPPVVVDAERTFANVSPQAALAYRFTSGRMAYVSVAQGFKAGGFNPASPSGNEAYGEERAWNLEAGVKTSWADEKVSVTAAVFRIGWDDMQLNTPNPLVPAQFYIANVGEAHSSGVEVEANARPRADIMLFASAALARARFDVGSQSGGLDVSGHDLPNTPDYAIAFGGQYFRRLGATAECYGRADVAFSGGYRYDESNREGQTAYSLANLRAGVRGRRLFAEAWAKNVFDTRYIPVAFAYAGLAPSGYVGELGQPRTFGLSLGVGF